VSTRISTGAKYVSKLLEEEAKCGDIWWTDYTSVADMCIVYLMQVMHNE